MPTATLNPKFEAQLLALVNGRLEGAVAEMADRVREEISEAFPPASEPGEPPHKRSGGLLEAVFHDSDEDGHVYGYQKVPDPDRPDADREWLGVWMEFGTGNHRQPFPPDSVGETPPVSGEKTSVQPRPVLMPILLEEGREIVERHLGGVS